MRPYLLITSIMTGFDIPTVFGSHTIRINRETGLPLRGSICWNAVERGLFLADA